MTLTISDTAPPPVETTPAKKTRQRKANPQRAHIRRLLRNARHPLTGARGISEPELRALASVPRLKTAANFIAFFDSLEKDEIRDQVQYTRAFTQDSGTPADWAVDIATILDMPVEQVFSYEYRKLMGEQRRAEAWPPDERWVAFGAARHEVLHLAPEPLDVPAPDDVYDGDDFKTARMVKNASVENTMPSEAISENPEAMLLRKEAVNAVYQALAAAELNPRDKAILTDHYALYDRQNHLSQQKIGQERCLTRAYIWHLERQAFRKLRTSLTSSVLRDLQDGGTRAHDPMGSRPNLYRSTVPGFYDPL